MQQLPEKLDLKDYVGRPCAVGLGMGMAVATQGQGPGRSIVRRRSIVKVVGTTKSHEQVQLSGWDPRKHSTAESKSKPGMKMVHPEPRKE